MIFAFVNRIMRNYITCGVRHTNAQIIIIISLSLKRNWPKYSFSEETKVIEQIKLIL